MPEQDSQLHGSLPDFLIIGAGKSGTTSLWSYLNQHPQIGMSAIKEPSYFSMDEVNARGLNWYRKLYAGLEERAVRGEASNSYSALQSFPQTIDRIADTLSHPKFIYITRHPADRTESDWMQRSRIEDISFSDFIRSEPVHADKNMYLRCFETYADKFGTDRILPLFYSDLRNNPRELLSRVCDFLDVDPDFDFDTTTQHGQSAHGRDFHFGLGRLRKLKLYADMSMMLPQGVKQSLRAGLSQPKSVNRPTWTSSDRTWFRERYEDISRSYLERVGQDPNFWVWE